MAQSCVMDGIKTSRVSPAFLHGNSTSHTWPFSAIAELIDNAYDPDVNAKQLWIDMRTLNDMECLTFVDNGKGLTEEKLHKMLSFGYCEKVEVGKVKPIGHYGNGFKSGSMRLGMNAMVFTRCTKSTSVGFLSQSYLKAINADEVLVPIVTWDHATSATMTRVRSQESDQNLQAILQHSLFNQESDLLQELKSLERMKTGTNIIIYDLKRDESSTLELDFYSDPQDIRNPETHVKDLTSINRPIQTALPEYKRSLREYCSILFLKPRMKIVLRGQKVMTKLISKSLSRTEIDTYRPTWLPGPIKLTFGFTTKKDNESYGLMMYHHNRLILAYEKIGCQKQANQHGVEVVGVVEANFLEPIHNKQDFNRTDRYSAFMQNAATKLNDFYWEKTQNENPERCLNQSELPPWDWVQCDICNQWRRLPTGYVEKLLGNWYCRMNPDAQFNRCDIPEEPEDEDKALQPTYKKTYKKKEEERRKQTKCEEEQKRLAEERKLQEKAAKLAQKEEELRKKEELAVSSSQDMVDRKRTERDLEVTQMNLRKYQQELAKKEKLISELEQKKQENEKNGLALLHLANSIEVNIIQEQQLVKQVNEMPGTSSTTVSSSSSHTLRTPVKRKSDDTGGNTEEKASGSKKMNVIAGTSTAEIKEEMIKEEMEDDWELFMEELDEQIHENTHTTKLAHKGSQTEPTVVKFASPEEVDLQKLSQIEQKQMMLQKARELDETKKSFCSFKENVWHLLKSIVPDFDYGNAEDIERIILDFIQVNGETSQNAIT